MTHGENLKVLDTVIVGGGIAGLTLGYRLRDRDILLLEQEEVCGGRTISRKLGEYVYNAGAQVILGDSSPVARLTDELGVQRTLIAKSKLPFFFKGKLVSSSNRLGLLWKLPMSLRDRFRLAWSLFKFMRRYRSLAETPFDNKDPKVIELTSTTLGEFIGPVSQDIRDFWEVMAQDSQNAGVDAVTPFFPLLLLRLFLADEYFVEGGTGRLTGALYGRIAPKTEIGAEVVEVKQVEEAVEVTYEKEGVRKTVKARRCAMATPAPITLKVVRDLPSWKRDALDRIPFGSISTAAFLLSEPSENILGKGIWRVPVSGRKACAVTDPTFTFPRELKERTGQGLIRVYTGDKVSKELMQLSDGEVAEVLLDDLVSMFPRIRGKVVQTDVAHWYHGIPQWQPGHMDIYPSLQAPTGRIHYCGDYASPGYMNGAVESAYRVLEEIKKAG
ncbi:MAG: FAD-dependent oxidoreductase [Dehalococcoidia bacterium]